MSKQAVKVCIRTRPTADFATKNLDIDPNGGKIKMMFEKNAEAGLINNQTDAWTFNFEKLLHNASQDETYECSAAEIIQSVVEGYNGTVMCYGQTGAGKTYTMTGSQTVFKYRGIVPRAINQVFALTNQKFDQAITIRVSYAEIYNEQIRDLLPGEGGGHSTNLQISDDQKGGCVVRGLSQHVCDSEEDALNCLFEGELDRTTGATALNAASSRAHTIFTIYIESRSRVESADKVTFSKLHLVDLAGCERTKKSDSQGIRLTEAQSINKSLSFLEQVVLALSDKKREHIPYRQAKLTNFLRDSLGGNCKTVMIANVWPEQRHLEEMSSTLKFATRMMKVSNEATVNILTDPSLQIKRYEKEIRDLKQELAMHDTLSNRGRINYASYNQKEQAEIQNVALDFLNGERDDIGGIDSLRKVREVFSCIRNQYRKTQQNIEAIKRQIEADPKAFQKLQEQKQKEAEEAAAKEAAEAEEAKDVKSEKLASEAGEPAEQEEVKSEQPEVKGKREAIDKQQAFLEFKDSAEGKGLEERIREHRETAKSGRTRIKALTDTINKNKGEIDALKVRLDKKEEERKVRLRDEQLKQEDMFEDAAEEIIDEEELVMLRQMKDLKKTYRDNFGVLKNEKREFSETQKQIDLIKEQLISQFEIWYATEFEVPDAQLEASYNQNLQNVMNVETKGPDSVFGGSQDDDEQALFMRTKKKVEVLNRAKKLEKSLGGRR